MMTIKSLHKESHTRFGSRILNTSQEIKSPWLAPNSPWLCFSCSLVPILQILYQNSAMIQSDRHTYQTNLDFTFSLRAWFCLGSCSRAWEPGFALSIAVINVGYMTCKSSGEQRLSPKCNCCTAPKDCIYIYIYIYI